MENDTRSEQVFIICALRLRLGHCCRSGTAVFTESIAVSRPFVSDVSLVARLPCATYPPAGYFRQGGVQIRALQRPKAI